MLNLTGELADGVVLSAGLTAEYAAQSLAMTEAGARATGRDPSAMRRAAYLYTAVDRDRAVASSFCAPRSRS